MNEENSEKIEDFLKAFSFKPAPPGLKNKILDFALKKQKTNLVKPAFLRKGFAGCLCLLIAICAVDAKIAHIQNRHISSFLDNPLKADAEHEDALSVLQEAIWEPLDERLNALKERALAYQEKAKKDEHNREWRESLDKELE